MTEKILIETLVGIFFIGILIQWLAWKFNFPSIILLLIVGVILGPVLNFIPPTVSEGHHLHAMLKLSLAVILFEGGLQLKFHELKQAGTIVRRMCFIGAPMHFGFLFLATYYVMGFSWKTALFFSSILIVTGPTVILPMLRQSKIPRKLSSGLKWEAIVVDPIGALLTVLFFDYVLTWEGSGGWGQLGVGISKTIFISFFLAYAANQLVRVMDKGAQLPDHLRAPFVLTMVFLIYLLADYIQSESGIFATTIFGILLGNRKSPIVHELHKFKEPLTVILISLIFIVLAATLDFHDFKYILKPQTLAYLFLIIFIIRPLTMTLSLTKTDVPLREKLFLGWIGPRGIVAAAVVEVFAPSLVTKGFPEAVEMVPLMFAIIFTTVVLHALSINPLAKKLKLSVQGKSGVLLVGANPWSQSLAKCLKEVGFPVLLADNNWHHLHNAKMQNLATFYGEVLADNSEELLDLTDISLVMATSDNDSYNALVCKHFSSLVGRDHVYQLPLHNFDNSAEGGLKSYLRGHVLIGEDEIYEQLEKYHYIGWKFKVTKLSDEYSIDDLSKDLHPDAKIIARIRNEKNLMFKVVNREFKPRKADVVISYGPGN